MPGEPPLDTLGNRMDLALARFAKSTGSGTAAGGTKGGYFAGRNIPTAGHACVLRAAPGGGHGLWIRFQGKAPLHCGHE